MAALRPAPNNGPGYLCPAGRSVPIRKGWPHRQLRLELKLNYAFDKVQVPLRETSKPNLSLSTPLQRLFIR